MANVLQERLDVQGFVQHRLGGLSQKSLLQ